MKSNACLKCAFLSTAKYACDNYDTVNRIKINLKSQCHALFASKFILAHRIENASVYDVACRAAKTIIVELKVHAATSTIGLFMQSIVVLQLSLFSYSDV